MELEIKHLAPYLEYGLVLSRAEWLPPLTLVGLTTLDVIHNSGSSPIRYMTPHLRPLSQLTEDITHNGKTFVPEKYFEDNHGHTVTFLSHSDGWYFEDEVNACATFEFLPSYIWAQLIEWHFDVFDLLESGLAIEKPNH